MNFWRGPAYQAFFEYLDEKGGFYYEVRYSSTSHLLADSALADPSDGEMPLYIA